MTGVPVIPVSAGATRGRFFGSWDRFLVPAPFAWTPVAFGEPYYVDRSASEEDLMLLAGKLEAHINQLTELVDRAALERRG
jgi:lysophospholipid acyltransferase (LPLAT)-like uncharacterized protein